MLRWVGLVVGVSFLGCSSSSNGSGSCTSSAACGGSLVGTWKLVDACETAIPQMSNSACPGETFQVGSVSINGTVTFGTDMTYSIALTESVTDTLNFPASCLTVGGVTLTCSQIAQSINTATASPDAGLSPTTCASSGSGCTCTLNDQTTTIDESGTYTISGGTFTTASANGGGMGGGSYCVSGNTLRVASIPTGTDGGAAGPGLQFVATKE